MAIVLDALATRVDQMIDVCRSLRDENQVLRRRIAQLEGDKHALEERMATARTRLETLMERLPEE